MKIVETIGERLARLREERKLSQTAVAKAAGMDQSTYSDIETGKNKKFSATSLMGMAEVLSTTPTYIMAGERGESPLEAELLGIVPRLNEDGIKHLLVSARGTAAQAEFLRPKAPAKKTGTGG